MSYTTVAIVYNPNSTGQSEAMAKDLEAKLHDRLPEQKIELIATKHAGHAEELAYTIAKASANPLVISSSGDGGYNELVNGAMKAQHEGYTITTSLLPAGNANDHHRNLSVGDVVELIASNETKKIDLLKFTGMANKKLVERYAHSYIGVGLTPKIGRVLNKNKLNLFNEMWLVVQALFVIKSVRLRVDERVQYYDSIIFSNIDSMSKYLKVSRASSVTDGKFEVTIFDKRGRFNLIMLLLKASFKGVREDSRTTTYEFETVDKTLIQADGETTTLDAQSHVSINIEKQILTCII